MFRQRQLDDKAVYIRISVQLLHTGQKLLFGNISLETDQRGFEATLFTGNHLILHIGFTSPVVPHQYGGQMRLLSTCGYNSLHFLGNLLLDGSGGCLSVD